MILILAVAGCSTDKSNTGNLSSQGDSLFRPDSEVSGARIYLYDKGQVTSEIYSKKIMKFEEKDSTAAYELNINIFDSTGRVSTHIVGDSGFIRENKGFMNIFGNVVVITDDSTTLETEYLWWDSNTDRIKTDAFVRITQGEDIITGWGLDADNRLKDFKILSQVSGTITDPEKLQQEK
jgi:LPS export ABC transporter protein LptC